MKLHREFVRDGATVAVTAEPLGGDRWQVRVGSTVHEFRAVATPDGGVRLQAAAGGPALLAYGAAAGQQFQVRVAGRTHALQAPAGRRGGPGGAADGQVRAPMTGTVLDVLCQPGDVVAADQTLVVVSAMKMEHKLTAGLAGTVQMLGAKKGEIVDQGAVLVVVEPTAKETP